MRRLLLLFSLLSTTALAQQAVPPLGTAALVCAYNTSIPTPVAGTFAYVQCDANGKLITNGAGGGISGPGTTVVGNLAAWNSTTGTALLDTGVNVSSNILTGAAGSTFNVLGATGQALLLGGNASPSFVFDTGSNFRPASDNFGGVGASTRRFGSGFFVNIGSSTVGLSSLYLQGSSSGTDLLSSGNTSASNRTITIPAGTTNDTLALLGATQTFSGAVTYSGSTLFSGAGATPSAAGNTIILGGTAAPTLGSTYTALAIGGNYSAGSLSLAGQGSVFTNATWGTVVQGKSSGGGADVSIFGAGGSVVATFSTNYGVGFTKLSNYTNNRIWVSPTAPTFTGGTAGTINGTLAFTFLPSSTAQNYVTITLPAATTGWACDFNDLTSGSGLVRQTGALSTTSVTATYYSAVTTPANWPNTTDIIAAKCAGL